MGRRCILVTGGARSGKSSFALDLAAGLTDRVLFVATAQALDDEMRRRIENHRKERPPTWRTVEAPLAIGRRVAEVAVDGDVVVVDCLTLLVSNVIMECLGRGDPDLVDAELAEARVAEETADLIRCIGDVEATFIVVSNEVGLGLVPDNPLGRVYRDCLGRANQQIARRADEVYFMVAGIPLRVR